MILIHWYFLAFWFSRTEYNVLLASLDLTKVLLFKSSLICSKICGNFKQIFSIFLEAKKSVIKNTEKLFRSKLKECSQTTDLTKLFFFNISDSLLVWKSKQTCRKRKSFEASNNRMEARILGPNCILFWMTDPNLNPNLAK